jgi:hypothetical protein
MLKYFRHENGDKSIVSADANFTEQDLNTILSTPLSKEGLAAREKLCDDLIQDDEAFREFQREMRKTGVLTNQSVAVVMNSKKNLRKVGAAAIMAAKAKKDEPVAQQFSRAANNNNTPSNNNSSNAAAQAKKAPGGLLNFTSPFSMPQLSKPRQRTSATKERFLEGVKSQQLSFGGPQHRSYSQGDVTSLLDTQLPPSFATRVSSFVHSSIGGGGGIQQRSSFAGVGVGMGMGQRGSGMFGNMGNHTMNQRERGSLVGSIGSGRDSQRGSFADPSEPRATSRLSMVGFGEVLRNSSFSEPTAERRKSYHQQVHQEALNIISTTSTAIDSVSSFLRLSDGTQSEAVLVDFPTFIEEGDEDASAVTNEVLSAVERSEVVVSAINLAVQKGFTPYNRKILSMEESIAKSSDGGEMLEGFGRKEESLSKSSDGGEMLEGFGRKRGNGYEEGTDDDDESVVVTF